MTLHSNIHHGDDTQDQHCLKHEHAFPSNTVLCNVHTGHVQEGNNTSSFVSSSAVSGKRHIPALHAQTGEPGVLAGENGQPNADPLDVYDLFQQVREVAKFTSATKSTYC